MTCALLARLCLWLSGSWVLKRRFLMTICTWIPLFVLPRSLGTIHAAVQMSDPFQPDAVIGLVIQNRDSFKVVFFFDPQCFLQFPPPFPLGTRIFAGVTMQSKVRRRPNCFNLLHQLRLLGKYGDDVEKAFLFNYACAGLE